MNLIMMVMVVMTMVIQMTEMTRNMTLMMINDNYNINLILRVYQIVVSFHQVGSTFLNPQYDYWLANLYHQGWQIPWDDHFWHSPC